MTHAKKYLVFLLLLCSIYSSAQTKSDSVNVIREANSLSSGNFKDVLKTFFQVAYDDISSDDKEISLSSNLFAIKLKNNPALNIDKNFLQQRFARNSNIEFSFKLDSNYSFNGVKAGYKYAIVNKRDHAVSQGFNTAVLQASKNYFTASQMITQEISRRYHDVSDAAVANSLVNEINDFFMTATKKYGQLSDEAKEIVRQFLYTDKLRIESYWNARTDLDKIYEQIKDDYAKKLLWTLSSKLSTYSDGFLFSNIDLESEVTTGLIRINEKNNIEFAANMNYSFLDDTLKKGRDLKRQQLSSEFGLNWVSRNKNDRPVFEFKAAGSLNYLPIRKYADEKRTAFVFEGTLRIHITNEISVPVEIKYDPQKENVFGFLNVKVNFDLLNKIFGNLQ